MDDCISREAAITVIYNQHVGGKEACENARPNTYGADLREIVADIEDIPAADVRPVVLCQDCKHYKAENKGKPWKSNRRYYCRSACIATNPDDFCSYGERKGGANT